MPKPKPAAAPIRANARGEVRMGRHTLRGDFNALCDFNALTGLDVQELDFGRPPNPAVPGDTGTPSRVTLPQIRALVQALGRFETPEAAGEAIGAVGLGAAGEAVGAALSAALGTAKAGGTQDGTPDGDDAGEA